jgi:two-component sensor histidine kinase
MTPPMSPQSRHQASRKLRILLLEDSVLDAELVTEALASAHLSVSIERVDTAADFTRAVQDQRWDIVLADYRLPAFDGLSALEIVQACAPGTPFVFVSGALGEEVAVEALKRGATDYVLKESLDRLPGTVLRALAEARERADKLHAQEALQTLLDQRTALLHELDHRVKNNLQLLLSLIGIEIRQAQDSQVRQVLGCMKERLQALAAAHRDLYDGKGAARFDATSFAKGLCQELAASLPDGRVTPEFHIESVEVEAAKAAPIALLFNEIVVNALTHAYTARHGKLKLTLRVRDGVLLFQLSDDAYSAEEKEAVQSCASGTVLQALSRQLDARMEWPSGDPAILVRLTMPVQDVN